MEPSVVMYGVGGDRAEDRLARTAEREKRRLEAKVKAREKLAERSERIAKAIEAVSDLAALPKEVVPREQIQSAIGLVVANSLVDAMKVMAGSKKWDTNQIRLFKLLIERVAPVAEKERLSLKESAQQRLNEMDASELEALLAQSVTGEMIEGNGDADQESER